MFMVSLPQALSLVISMEGKKDLIETSIWQIRYGMGGGMCNINFIPQPIFEVKTIIDVT